MCLASQWIAALVIVGLRSCDAGLEFAGTLTLGGPASFTGGHVATSTMVRRGFELWASHVNETKTFVVRGKIFAVDLVFEDDGSTESGALEVMQRLLPKLDIAIAPYSSGLTLAVLPAIISANKVMIATTASSRSVYSQGAPVIGTMPPAADFLKSTLRLLKKQGATSFGGLVNSEKVFSVESCTAASEEAERLGLEPQGFEHFAEGLKGATSQISSAKLRNPEIFIGCGHLNDAIFVALASKAVGFSPKAMILLNAGRYDFIDALGEATANEIASASPWHAESIYTGGTGGVARSGFLGNAQAFNETFVMKYGREPSYQAAASTAAGLVIAQAVTVAGTVEAESLIPAARAIRIESSMYGPIAFDTGGQLVRENFAVVQIKNGKVTAVNNETIAYPLRLWSDRELELVNRACPSGSVPVVSVDSSICEPCAPGFFRTVSMIACSRCEEGTYSSEPGAEICLPCLVPRNCFGCRASVEFSKCNADNTDVIALPGFYRLPGTTAFSPCKTPELCIGDNRCMFPNHGVLCEQCDLGYTNSGQPGTLCNACPSPDLNWARVSVITWLYILYICLLVRSATHKKRHISKLFSIVMRLTVNYLQMSSIALLNCAFLQGNFLNNLFAFMDLTGDPMESVMDIGCILRSYGQEPTYTYIIIGHCLCPAVMLANLIIHAVKRCLRLAFHIKVEKNFLNRCVSSSIISLFILHPIVTKLMFKGLDCQSLDTFRVTSNLDLTCNSESHKRHAASASVGLVLWACGIPLFAFVVMFRNRFRLHEPHIIMRYGFLYNGFEGKFWFFELIYAYRKVLLILSMGVPFPSLRIAILLSLGLVFLKIHLKYKPFDNRNFLILDRLETANLTAFNGTLLTQLIYDLALTIPSLKSEDGEASALRGFLQSDVFRVLLVMIVLFLHGQYIVLVVCTVCKEVLIMPSKFLVDYSDMLPEDYKIPTWRRWLAACAHDEKRLYFDDVRQELCVDVVSAEEQDFVAASLGEVLGSFISKVKCLHPSLLTVAIREAVQHIYVHKHHHLDHLRLEARSKQKAMKLMRQGSFQKVWDIIHHGLEGKKKSEEKEFYHIKDVEIDDVFLNRLKEDGFSAEELHNALMRLENGSDEQDQQFLSRVTDDHNSIMSLQAYLRNGSSPSENSSPGTSTLRACNKETDPRQHSERLSPSGLQKFNGLQELHFEESPSKASNMQDPFHMRGAGSAISHAKQDKDLEECQIEDEKLDPIVDAHLNRIMLPDPKADSTDSGSYHSPEQSQSDQVADSVFSRAVSLPAVDDHIVTPSDHSPPAPPEPDHHALRRRLDDMLSHMQQMLVPAGSSTGPHSPHAKFQVSTPASLSTPASTHHSSSPQFDTNELLEQQMQHLGARPQGLELMPRTERSHDELLVRRPLDDRSPNHDPSLLVNTRGNYDPLWLPRSGSYHKRVAGDLDGAVLSAGPDSGRQEQPDSSRQSTPPDRPLTSRSLRRLDHPQSSIQASSGFSAASTDRSQPSSRSNMPLRSILAPKTAHVLGRQHLVESPVESPMPSSRLQSGRRSNPETRRLRWGPSTYEHDQVSVVSEAGSAASHNSCILGSSLMNHPEATWI